MDPGFDRDECTRWFEQAQHTLESAGRDLEDGDYAWSCFYRDAKLRGLPFISEIEGHCLVLRDDLGLVSRP